MEYKIAIAGVEYTASNIRSGYIERPLFDEVGIGNACMSMLSFTARLSESPPAMAEIIVYAKDAADWYPLGTFYIDERSQTSTGLTTIIAYDSMLKADIVWTPDQSLEFPLPMSEAVSILAGLVGIEVDERTVVSGDYTIDYPANDNTIRDILKYIAAANGGNWTITRENKFLLVPLNGEGVQHDIGGKALALTTHKKRSPISKVILYVDDENYLQSGDDTGSVVDADCPYASQEICDSVLSALSGYEYQPFSAVGASLLPTAELGDTLTVGGVTGPIAVQKVRFSSGAVMDVSAPGSDETAHEYKTEGELQRRFERSLASARSEITKSSEQINLRIDSLASDAEGYAKKTELTLLEKSITSQVADLEKENGEINSRVTTVEQTASSVSIAVQNIIDNGVDRVKTETGYEFNSDGLKIHKSGDEMENILDNTGMYVMRGDETMLQANANGVVATDVTIRNYLVIGHARFESYGSDRTACFYI